MADQRKGGIAWTDTTWGTIRGCSRVSEGCRNCYAERMAARFCGPRQPYEGLITGGRWSGEVRLVEERLDDPLHWRRPRRIFVDSMSDLFHESVSDEAILRVFDVMRQASQHVYQVLSKRPERMRDFCKRVRFDGMGNGRIWLADTDDGPGWRLMGGNGCSGMPWVWIGVSVEDQATADRRIPLLLDTPAAVRWVSCEPLLGPVDLDPWIGCTCVDPQGCAGVAGGGCRGLNWVVVGGESGPHRRSILHPDWVRRLRDQCAGAGTPFFFKGWGVPGAQALLDDQAWAQFPEVQHG